MTLEKPIVNNFIFFYFMKGKFNSKEKKMKKGKGKVDQ